MSVFSEMQYDVTSLESMFTQMTQLDKCALAIESYGLTAASIDILKSKEFLSPASISTVGLESWHVKSPDSTESRIALESITEKMKDIAGKWSAKIMEVAGSFGKKIMSVIDPIWNKITATVNRLTSKTWEGTKAAGSYAKAHPVKTLIAAVAAIAAVAGVIALVSTGMNPGQFANESQLTTFLHRVSDKISGIKWPFGKITADVVDNGKTIKCVVESAGNYSPGLNAVGEVAGPGAIKTIFSQLGRAVKMIKEYVGKFLIFSVKGAQFSEQVGKHYMGKITKKAWIKNAAGDITMRVYFFALVGIIKVIINLIKRVVVGTLRIISQTFSALAGHAEPQPA
jgi:hypothetical protein